MIEDQNNNKTLPPSLDCKNDFFSGKDVKNVINKSWYFNDRIIFKNLKLSILKKISYSYESFCVIMKHFIIFMLSFNGNESLNHVYTLILKPWMRY